MNALQKVFLFIALAAVLSWSVWRLLIVPTMAEEGDGTAAMALTQASSSDAGKELPAPRSDGRERELASSVAERTDAALRTDETPAPDAALASRLGLDGFADVLVVDAKGQPLPDEMVLIVPEATWNWLKVGPDRAQTYLANLRAEPSSAVWRSGADGFAHASHLSRTAPLRAIGGSGRWVMSASSSFGSGNEKDPMRVELALYARASIEVRVVDQYGSRLPILSGVARPDASSGVEPIQNIRDLKQPAPSAFVLTPVPANVPCAVEVTVMLENRPCIVRGTANPESERVFVLDLVAETAASESALAAEKEEVK